MSFEDTTPVEPLLCRTDIVLSSIEKIYDDDIDIFHVSLSRLVYILQTRTAIGYLNTVWDRAQPQIEVILRHTDLNNETNTINVPFRYQLPSAFLKQTDVIDYLDLMNKMAMMDDSQKSAHLRGKSLQMVGSVDRAGRRINYYGFFAPSRNLWKNIASTNGLTLGGEIAPEFKAGIFLATKGMPTGVELVPPSTGQAGYWANLYILIEDNRLDLDLGRKSIPGPTQAMFKDIAKDLFTKFTALAAYVSVDPATSQHNATVQIAQKQQAFGQLEQINNLGVRDINFMKHPDGQEAAVAAIFHELIGAGLLMGYYGLKRGYKETYDFWGKYRIDPSLIGSQFSGMGSIDVPLIIEFKHDAHKIIEDVDYRRKFFIDMDLLVCWDIDVTKFNKANIQVKPLSPDEVFFHGSNYELMWPGAYNLGSASRKPVLSLRKLIEERVQGITVAGQD